MQCNVRVCDTNRDTKAYGVGLLFIHKKQVYCITCRHICPLQDIPVMIFVEKKFYITSPMSYNIPDRNKDIVVLKVLNHDGEGVQPLSDYVFDVVSSKIRVIYDNYTTRVTAIAEPYHTSLEYFDSDDSYWASKKPLLIHSKSRFGESGTPVYSIKGFIGIISSIATDGDYIDCPQVLPVSKQDILGLLKAS